MKLYLTYIGMHLRTVLQHRASFFILSLGQACFAITSFVSVVLLVPPEIEVLGFTRMEILLAGAIINISFSLAECFARGFDTFGSIINSGRFDIMITRPISEIKQVFMQTIEFTKIGRFLVSFIVLVMVLQQFDKIPVLYLILLILCGTCLYICLFIIYGSICFYTTKNLEVFNLFTDGTKEFGKVPFSFYGDVFLKFVTFIIPLALIQYYPLLYILGKSDSVIFAVSPLLALLFYVPTRLFWIKSRKYYSSTGS